MENYKTIKELADEIGVSKQAVWQKIKRRSSTNLRQFMTTKSNTVYVSVDGQNIIKTMFSNNKNHINKDVDDNVDDVEVNVYGYVENEEILFLRELVNQLQDEKKELHKILDQQQQLTLQTNKQIEQLQSQLVFLLTDNDEQAMMKEESFDDKKESESVKKWYHFWK